MKHLARSDSFTYLHPREVAACVSWHRWSTFRHNAPSKTPAMLACIAPTRRGTRRLLVLDTNRELMTTAVRKRRCRVLEARLSEVMRARPVTRQPRIRFH